MASAMLRRHNFRIRRGPQNSWIVQSLIDEYNDFKRRQESARETITTSEVERTGTSNGKVVESKNPAASKVQRMRKKKGKGVESKNAAAIRGSKQRMRKTNRKEFEFKNPTDFPEDVTLRELLQREKNRNKNKKNQKALQVEEARLAKSSHAGSYGGLSGFKPPGSVSRMHEPMVAFDVGEPRFLLTNAGSYGRLSMLKPSDHEVMACSVNRNPAEFSTEIAKWFMRRI